MFDNFLGLPLHPLVIHLVVVGAPLTALMLLLYAVSARFRVWSGWLTPVVATLTTLVAFVASNSGESLEHRLPENPAIEQHAELGQVLPWVVLGSAVVSWVLWLLWRRDRMATTDTTAAAGERRPVAAEAGTVTTSLLTKVIAVVGVVVAIGLAVDVTLVGHSGAEAVWKGTPTQSQSGGGDEG